MRQDLSACAAREEHLLFPLPSWLHYLGSQKLWQKYQLVLLLRKNPMQATPLQ
ncbi:hypothetical protein C4K04_2574 [Pseudomonas chlororaphis]|uniref:Uncharacterized protein n=1 Tax=Pseudomonas chlororaphis TaxID=587753 RepID=A0A3G7TMB1_9PSED|nr:hypothetical protein C4K04_2574 [Pseudomonas chlororaphis]